MWNSPLPEKRWNGFRRQLRGLEAFASRDIFEQAQIEELREALAEHELPTLGRLLARGKKPEIELFIRTHGPNPLFDPQMEMEVPVGIAKADVVDLRQSPSDEAVDAILDGRVLHVLFQAGEASRFDEGPFYTLNPVDVARRICQAPAAVTNGHGKTAPTETKEMNDVLESLTMIERLSQRLSPTVASFLRETPLGPKQPVLLRAALRRLVQREVNRSRLTPAAAIDRYRSALRDQKLLFFVNGRGNVSQAHDESLRERHHFFGFFPPNVVTIEQELIRGVTADEDGRLSLLDQEATSDAAGHLYALLQAARRGDFTTHTDSGRPIKPMELDAFSYFIGRGAQVLNVVRINDMDRHSTEIINARALSYALEKMAQGYVNVVETVANPAGQKGGTGTTFGDPDTHVLTETHENSFPALSRAFDGAMKTYLEENRGRHPAYNAMRQWADVGATRTALRQWGARIVFVPRAKMVQGQETSYLGVDMPMGDLSLLHGNYRTRLFQFRSGTGDLLIHDMKQKEHLPIGLRTVARQFEDPHVLAAVEEMQTDRLLPFEKSDAAEPVYGAPAPEFDGNFSG